MSKLRSVAITLLCALAVPLLALLGHLQVEMGMNDDWSYIRSAQLFASTGHIVYNGWSSPLLGWQLYAAAPFLHVLGMSFTAPRLAVLLIAALCTATFHRIALRCGVQEPWAALGTLTLALSPVFVPLSVTFMTDISGLFAMLLCLYLCLRAVHAGTSRRAILWLALACLSNAVGGTARQIAWLGLFITVPSALWLLRRQRRVLIAGVAFWLAGLAWVAVVLRWLAHQPHMVPESPVPSRMNAHILFRIAMAVVMALLETPALLLPVLLPFLLLVRPSGRALRLCALIVAVLLLAALPPLLHHHLAGLLFPQLPNSISPSGIMQGTPLRGVQPILLGIPLRVTLTLITTLAALAAVAAFTDAAPRVPSSSPASLVTPRQLSVLLAPTTAAYLFLLLPRAGVQSLFDRYLLLPVAFLLLVLLRFLSGFQWQSPGQRRNALGLATTALIVIAGFSLCGTHDIVARLRAQRLAIAELRTASLSPHAIDGGFEYNSWNEILSTGAVDPRRLVLASDLDLQPGSEQTLCAPVMAELFTTLHPAYALSYQPAGCGRPASFAPVPYTEWLRGGRTAFVYIVQRPVP